MIRSDILRMMAWEADPFKKDGKLYALAKLTPETLERFAALVAAAEADRIANESKHIIKRAEERGAAAERNRKWTQAHWTEYERSIAAATQEACADICDQHASIEGIAQRCAAAIRAMGDK